jgi:small subunit ribosomal protein S13
MLYTFKDVDLPEHQVLRSALTKICGVGFIRSNYLCDTVGLSAECRTDNLNSYFFFVITYVIKQYYGTDVFLKRMRENRVKSFVSFKSYKAIRYAAGLPIRGQHTHTNAKTAKYFRSFGR